MDSPQQLRYTYLQVIAVAPRSPVPFEPFHYFPVTKSMQDVREPDRRDATFAVGGGGTAARIAGGCGGCQVLRRARASISVFRQSDRDSVIIEIEGGSGDFIHNMRRKVRGGEARGSGELFWVSSFRSLNYLG